MIRKSRQSDIDEIVNIWLEASIQAHDFIDSEFWKSKARDMKEIYIPSGETYVFEQEGVIKGFISLSDDTLAAIFVAPGSQGQGIGTRLMRKARDIRDNLNLTVYTDNLKSVEFYIENGFEIEREQIDEHTGHPELVMKYSSLATDNRLPGID